MCGIHARKACIQHAHSSCIRIPHSARTPYLSWLMTSSSIAPTLAGRRWPLAPPLQRAENALQSRRNGQAPPHPPDAAASFPPTPSPPGSHRTGASVPLLVVFYLHHPGTMSLSIFPVVLPAQPSPTCYHPNFNLSRWGFCLSLSVSLCLCLCLSVSVAATVTLSLSLSLSLSRSLSLSL